MHFHKMVPVMATQYELTNTRTGALLGYYTNIDYTCEKTGCLKTKRKKVDGIWALSPEGLSPLDDKIFRR